MIIDLCCIYSKIPPKLSSRFWISTLPWCIHCCMHYCSLLLFYAFILAKYEILWRKKPLILKKKKNHPPFCSRKQIACSWELSHQEFSRSRYTSIILMFLLMFPNNVLWNQNHFLSFSYTSDALHHISDQKWGVIPQPLPARAK